MTGGDRNTWVPGIRDLVEGNTEKEILPVSEKISRGILARNMLLEYKEARLMNNVEQTDILKGIFRDRDFINNYFRYFGYAPMAKPEDAIPNVPVSFYSFHIMVLLGFYFILFFALALYFHYRGTLARRRWYLWMALWSIPLPYIAGELGWVVAEMGRQPWIIQDLMLVSTGVTRISSGAVITTFILFAVLFTALLAAEISIMVRQIRLGPKNQEIKI